MVGVRAWLAGGVARWCTLQGCWRRGPSAHPHGRYASVAPGGAGAHPDPRRPDPLEQQRNADARAVVPEHATGRSAGDSGPPHRYDSRAANGRHQGGSAVGCPRPCALSPRRAHLRRSHPVGCRKLVRAGSSDSRHESAARWHQTPFGKVVRPLQPHRETIAAQILWSPLPTGWEVGSATAVPAVTADCSYPPRCSSTARCSIRPGMCAIAEVHEVYQRDLLAFPQPRWPRFAATVRPAGRPAAMIPDRYDSVLALKRDAPREWWRIVPREDTRIRGA